MSIAAIGAVVSVAAAAASAFWAWRSVVAQRESTRAQELSTQAQELSTQVATASAQDDLQDKFNKLISTLSKLQAEAGELGAQGMTAAETFQATQAKQSGLGNQLVLIADQAHSMIHPDDENEPTPDVGWSAAYVLGTTFDQAGYVLLADDYWKMSVANAKQEAKVFALLGQARHYFFRNDEGDFDQGRRCQSEAIEQLLRPADHGHDTYVLQRFFIYSEAVGIELQAGHRNEMVTAVWNSFKETEQIHAPTKAWPCKVQVFNFIATSPDLLAALNDAPDATPEEKSALMTQWQQWHATAFPAPGPWGLPPQSTTTGTGVDLSRSPDLNTNAETGAAGPAVS
jgi:hypothetical protein